MTSWHAYMMNACLVHTVQMYMAMDIGACGPPACTESKARERLWV